MGKDVIDPIISSRLPLGIAGILAMCFGIAGAVVGMSEVCHFPAIVSYTDTYLLIRRYGIQDRSGRWQERRTALILGSRYD